MQITLSVATIANAMKRLMPAVPQRTSLPILTNLLATANSGGISLRATDLELDLTVGVSGAAGTPGTMLIPARSLRRFAQNFGKAEAVTIGYDLDTNRVTFSCGSVSISLVGQDIKEFPKHVALTAAKKAKIDFDALGHVLPACSRDDARPILTGIYIDGNNTVATDSYRLYICESAVEVAKPLLIPYYAAEMLAKVGGVHEITFNDRWLAFHAEGYSLKTALLEGTFPDWQRIAPTANAHNMLSWEDTDLPSAVSSLHGLAKGQPELTESPVKFEGDPITATIGGGHDDAVRLTAKFLGTVEGQVAFNHAYLDQLLKGAPVNNIEGFSTLKPFFIRWEDDTHKHLRLLMPVRVS